MIDSSENTERIENEIRGFFGTHQVGFIEEKLEGIIEVALVTRRIPLVLAGRPYEQIHPFEGGDLSTKLTHVKMFWSSSVTGE